MSHLHTLWMLSCRLSLHPVEGLTETILLKVFRIRYHIWKVENIQVYSMNSLYLSSIVSGPYAAVTSVWIIMCEVRIRAVEDEKLLSHHAAPLYRRGHGERGSEDGQTAATNHQREVSGQDSPHYCTQVKVSWCISVTFQCLISHISSVGKGFTFSLVVVFCHQDQHHNGQWSGAGDARWEDGGVWQPGCSLPIWPLRLPQAGWTDSR